MINYKTIIAPIIAVIALLSELVFKVKLPDEVQNGVIDTLSNLVAVGVVVYGIFKNHKIEVPKEENK